MKAVSTRYALPELSLRMSRLLRLFPIAPCLQMDRRDSVFAVHRCSFDLRHLNRPLKPRNQQQKRLVSNYAAPDEGSRRYGRQSLTDLHYKFQSDPTGTGTYTKYLDHGPTGRWVCDVLSTTSFRFRSITVV